MASMPVATVVVRQLAPWLDHTVPALHQAIVRRALCDVGLLELPPGSNRSPRIDEYVRAVGSPLGSYWCAAALAAWWRESGAATPPRDAGSCDAWLAWAKATGRWSPNPVEGAAVLYGHGADASHCGALVRRTPLLLTVEGNTALRAYARNGVACDLKELLAERLLGYVHPTPLGA